MKATACGRPTCTNNGSSTCSRCGSISYCSQNCQKEHWSDHKATCKAIAAKKANGEITPSTSSKLSTPPSSVPSSGVSLDFNEFLAKIQGFKVEIQKAFQSNDTKSVIKLGNDALLIAKLLPEPMASGESMQMHLHISNAMMQSNQVKDAESHINSCLEFAERSVSLRPNHPQPLEMLSIAQVSKVYWLINQNRISEATELAKKAREIASNIYPPSEPRNFKTLRCLGILYDKQDKVEEAEKLLSHAYELQLTVGPENHELAMVTDDLINMHIKRGNDAGAEKYARMYHEYLCDKMTLDAPPALVIGDAAARLSSILCRQNRHAEAESLMQQSLQIREKFLGPGAQPVAMTLVAVAGIAETLKKPKEEVEKILVRANEIFVKVEGPNSFHSRNTSEHLKRLRAGHTTVMGDNSYDDLVVTSENKKASGSNDDDDDDSFPSFHPHDGQNRMRQSAIYYEQGKFSKAERMLAEAYEIFLAQHGDDHAITKACKQNLGVARHHGLEKLWKDVVREAYAEQELKSKGSETPSIENMWSNENEQLWYVKNTNESSCVIS